MDNLLFSIIVPVYNSAQYLRECLDSILQQTVDCYEILLIENGSTDASPQICDFYETQYSNVRTYHIPNGGLSDARNYGVNHADGNYLVFIDSDDFVTSTMLEIFIKSISKFPDVQVITSNGKFLTYKNKMYPAQYPEALKKLDGKNGVTWVTAFLSTGVDDWNGPGKCFQKEFWTTNRFEFKVGRLSEDVELVYKVLLEAQSITIVNTFYYYRQARPDSIITAANPKLVSDTVLNLKEWDEYLSKNKKLNEAQKKLFYERFSKQYCTSVLGLIYAFPLETRKQLIKEAKLILFYLEKGNSNLVCISRIISSILGLKTLCAFLYFARQMTRYMTRLKWLVKGTAIHTI